ncbi:hypothetical protein SAMN05443582_101787 [Phyllobacterium sp. OV277]|nr:hypothetical protein SAMN05443582_101787 [Phyllobacterium sp. OV277]
MRVKKSMRVCRSNGFIPADTCVFSEFMANESWFGACLQENREAGENPARAQRCKRGWAAQIATEISGRRAVQMNLSQKTGRTR